MTSSDRPFTDGAETEGCRTGAQSRTRPGAEIADAFRRTGRVHIPDILTDASARRLFRTLERETPWGLIFNEGKKTREFEAVSAEDHQEMAIAAWERAHTSFQYFYFYYRLLENRKIYPKPGHYLAKIRPVHNS